MDTIFSPQNTREPLTSLELLALAGALNRAEGALRAQDIRTAAFVQSARNDAELAMIYAFGVGQ